MDKIPTGWTNYEFGKAINFNPQIKLQKGEQYAFIEMDDVNPENKFVKYKEKKTYDSSGCAKFKHGDILFARITPCLDNKKIATAFIGNGAFGFGSTEFIVLRAKEGITTPDYVHYLSKSEYIIQNAINSYVGASGRQRADTVFIKKVRINLPSVGEQYIIANILSAYDSLIESNIQYSNILEQKAEQLYKEWFVRFRFPGHEKVKFEMGVPKGWLKELKEYIKVIKGKSYTGEEINEHGEGKAFLNLKSFHRGGGYRYDGIKFYTGKHQDNQIVKEGDIVMAVTDMTQDRAVVGRVARIPKTQYSEMVISLDTAKIVPDKKLPGSFIYATLRFGFFGNTIKEFANGSNVLHLKPELAYKMKSIIPDDIELMKKFDKIIEPYFNLIDNLNLENQNLKQTRDLLLPRLISGKLKVKDLGKGAKKK
jgi:restriction endonuclease S subunit